MSQCMHAARANHSCYAGICYCRVPIYEEVLDLSSTTVTVRQISGAQSAILSSNEVAA